MAPPAQMQQLRLPGSAEKRPEGLEARELLRLLADNNILRSVRPVLTDFHASTCDRWTTAFPQLRREQIRTTGHLRVNNVCCKECLKVPALERRVTR